MRQLVPQSVLALALLLAPGCASFELAAGEPDGVEATGSTQVVTFHGSYWPFSWSDSTRIQATKGDTEDPANPEPCTAGIHKVESHSNLGYGLASILTLGLWVPMTVESWCLVETRDDTDSPIHKPKSREEETGDDPDEEPTAGTGTAATVVAFGGHAQ